MMDVGVGVRGESNDGLLCAVTLSYLLGEG